LYFRSFEAEQRNQKEVFAKSKYDFVARNSNELSLLRGDVVQVTGSDASWELI